MNELKSEPEKQRSPLSPESIQERGNRGIVAAAGGVLVGAVLASIGMPPIVTNAVLGGVAGAAIALIQTRPNPIVIAATAGGILVGAFLVSIGLPPVITSAVLGGVAGAVIALIQTRPNLQVHRRKPENNENIE
jgi:hypothetical protein